MEGRRYETHELCKSICKADSESYPIEKAYTRLEKQWERPT